MKWIPVAIIESLIVIFMVVVIVFAGESIIENLSNFFIPPSSENEVRFTLTLSSYEELKELAKKIDRHFSYFAVKYNREMKTFNVIFKMTERQAKEFVQQKEDSEQ